MLHAVCHEVSFERMTKLRQILTSVVFRVESFNQREIETNMLYLETEFI